MRTSYKTILLVLAFVALSLAGYSTISHAQSYPENIQSIDIKSSDDNPSPGENITLTASSYVTDLNSANITWTVNGAVNKKGVGATSIDISAPALGKHTTVAVSAITSEGTTIKYSTIIGSGNVDIIFERDGYVPPFFKGKIPFSYQNSYRIIAVPHLVDSKGIEYDPKSLVYAWQKDSKAVQDQSGYGKQVFSWKDEVVPRQRVITVSVSSRDGQAQAEKTYIIQAVSPFIVFYKNDPLFGPYYNMSIGNTIGLGKTGEASVIAAPFGFNKPISGIGDLSFDWLVNSVSQAALSTSQSITLRAPGDADGSSDIHLRIRNNKDILQAAESNFIAKFSKMNAKSDTGNTTNYNGL